jgi:hypothetical protein
VFSALFCARKSHDQSICCNVRFNSGDKIREYVQWEGKQVFVNTAPCCRKHLRDTLVDLMQCQQTHLPGEVMFLSHGAILGWRRHGGFLPHVSN